MAQKLYFGSPDRTAVEGKKIYCGVDNTSKLVKKIYVGQSGKSVQVYPSVTDRWYAPGWYRFNWRLITDYLQVNPGRVSVDFGIKPNNDETMVIFPFGCTQGSDTGFETLTFSGSSLRNIVTDGLVSGMNKYLVSSDIYSQELAAPDANYFYVTKPFRIQGETSASPSMIYGSGGIGNYSYSMYDATIQQAVPFGSYSLKFSNLLIPYSTMDSKFQSDLTRFHANHKKVYFTYYSEAYPGYVGVYINLDITRFREIDLLDYSQLMSSNEYLQSAYDSGAQFALFPDGTVTLGLYSVEEGSWKEVSMKFSELMPRGKSEQDKTGNIWIPFSQPLISENYNMFCYNYIDPEEFSNYDDRSKLAYWVSDPLCHILISRNSTSSLRLSASFTCDSNTSSSLWDSDANDYWNTIYNNFGFAVAPMVYKSIYAMSEYEGTPDYIASDMNLNDIDSNVLKYSVYPKGGSVSATSSSNGYVFVWGTGLISQIYPSYVSGSDLYYAILKDMPKTTFYYDNFAQLSSQLDCPLSMTLNTSIRNMPLFYEGQMTYIPGWITVRNPVIYYYQN